MTARKLTKAAVHYRAASTPGRRCGTCSMYVRGGRCTLVAGPIATTKVCDRWAPRKARS